MVKNDSQNVISIDLAFCKVGIC